jgi:hypothetical protein
MWNDDSYAEFEDGSKERDAALAFVRAFVIADEDVTNVGMNDDVVVVRFAGGGRYEIAMTWRDDDDDDDE